MKELNDERKVLGERYTKGICNDKLMKPEIRAGFTLLPLKTTSDSHPAPTVPAIAKNAEKPMIQLAVSREKLRAPCR